jgi:hypothetical protein
MLTAEEGREVFAGGVTLQIRFDIDRHSRH